MILNSHPKISEAAVVGITEPGRAENDLPYALVIRNTNTLSQKEVVDYVAERVSHFKRLRGVAFVDKIEKVKPERLRLISEPNGKTVQATTSSKGHGARQPNRSLAIDCPTL
jgi:acyl-CoA synthetase (AMP-forming)/AMP-acid ligase II